MSRLFGRPPSSKTVASVDNTTTTTSNEEDYDTHSVYFSLLDPVSKVQTQQQQQQIHHHHRRTKPPLSGGTSSHQDSSFSSPRPWLMESQSRPSWNGGDGRPSGRKLVKEPGSGSGSGARPSFSVELMSSDSSDEAAAEERREKQEKGIVRRNIDRLRGLYRRKKWRVCGLRARKGVREFRWDLGFDLMAVIIPIWESLLRWARDLRARSTAHVPPALSPALGTFQH